MRYFALAKVNSWLDNECSKIGWHLPYIVSSYTHSHVTRKISPATTDFQPVRSSMREGPAANLMMEHETQCYHSLEKVLYRHIARNGIHLPQKLNNNILSWSDLPRSLRV